MPEYPLRDSILTSLTGETFLSLFETNEFRLHNFCLVEFQDI